MLRFLTAGESHGPCLVAIVEGLPAGLRVDLERVNAELQRRQGGYGRGGRMQIERDRAEWLGGVTGGRTTGAPVALRIENCDWANWQDKELPAIHVPRPGHADLAGAAKYGLDDMRLVLERASARETAARTAVGALARALLAEFDIVVGGHVVEIGGCRAEAPRLPLEERIRRAEASPVRCADPAASDAMCRRIDRAREDGDSVGGVFEILAEGVPVGLGSHVHWDRRLDGRLAGAVMSIPGVKGVEIGPAFENAAMPGSLVHDEIFPGEDGVQRRANRAGGLEGGITNGEPVIVRAAMKPIPSLLKPLQSMDTSTGEAAPATYQRSDVCAVPAATVVGEAMVAWVLADALVEKLGGDSIGEMVRHWKA